MIIGKPVLHDNETIPCTFCGGKAKFKPVLEVKQIGFRFQARQDVPQIVMEGFFLCDNHRDLQKDDWIDKENWTLLKDAFAKAGAGEPNYNEVEVVLAPPKGAGMIDWESLHEQEMWELMVQRSILRGGLIL